MYDRGWNITKRSNFVFEKSRNIGINVRRRKIMVLHNLDVRNKLAEKTGLYKKDVNLVLDAFRELVYEEMEEGNMILLKNLFRIEPTTIKATKRYDIRQKDFFMDDEHKKIKIKPSRNLDKTMKAKK